MHITPSYHSPLRRKAELYCCPSGTIQFRLNILVIFAHYYHYYLSLYCIPSCCIVSSCICVNWWDLVAGIYWKINFISEHGAFPSVFAWVWHREPGNLHPCNSNAWITYYYPYTILSRSYPHPYTRDYRKSIQTVPQPTHNDEVCSKAFPSVIVRVWHGEPGNMHP